MIEVKMQSTNSEKNRLDKVVTDILTCQCVLKSETSIQNPTLRLSVNISAVKDCNYLTIPNFGRSYFIEDIRSVANHQIEVDCRVDVLTSFKDGIRGNIAVLRKQENLWNLYLDDGSLNVYSNPNIVTKKFPNGFSTYEYVLAVAGG